MAWLTRSFSGCSFHCRIMPIFLAYNRLHPPDLFPFFRLINNILGSKSWHEIKGNTDMSLNMFLILTFHTLHKWPRPNFSLQYQADRWWEIKNQADRWWEIKNQADRWWEIKKNANKRIISWPTTKFSTLTF